MIIVNKTKVGEENDSLTVTFSNFLDVDKFIIGGEQLNTVTSLNSNRQGIFITNSLGEASFLPVPEGEAGRNTVLIVKENGELKWSPR